MCIRDRYHTVLYLKALRNSFEGSFGQHSISTDEYQNLKHFSTLLPDKNFTEAVNKNQTLLQTASQSGFATDRPNITRSLRDWIRLHQSIMG